MRGTISLRESHLCKSSMKEQGQEREEEQGSEEGEVDRSGVEKRQAESVTGLIAFLLSLMKSSCRW